MERPLASTLEELTASLNEIMQRIREARADVKHWSGLLEKINSQIHEIASKGQETINKAKEDENEY
mgnify:FL=1